MTVGKDTFSRNTMTGLNLQFFFKLSLYLCGNGLEFLSYRPSERRMLYSMYNIQSVKTYSSVRLFCYLLRYCYLGAGLEHPDWQKVTSKTWHMKTSQYEKWTSKKGSNKKPQNEYHTHINISHENLATMEMFTRRITDTQKNTHGEK